MYTQSLAETIKDMQILHTSQNRKYTGEPYWTHLSAVAGLALKYYYLVADEVSLPVFTAVGWGHDCREDQGVDEQKLKEISKSFNDKKDRDDFAYGVSMLSDLEVGNRQSRLEASRTRLSKALPWVQAIKCADKQHNFDSIFLKDPDFFNIFADEATKMLMEFSPKVSIAVNDTLKVIQTKLAIQEKECNCPICSIGKLRINVYRIPYHDKNGILRYIPDQEGRYCTKCGNVDFTGFVKSQEKIDNIIRKGGVLVK